MSGAEGIAGLAIGAVGLTALFTTCIDAFNVVIAAREFGHDFEILCADLALQRLRLCLWGEAVGFIAPDPVQNRLAGLEDPRVQPTIVQTLEAIKSLLGETSHIRDQFSLPQRSSRVLTLFRNTYDDLRQRADRNQRQQSVPVVTKWAVYSKDRLKDRIERLKSLIDGLENVSRSLGVSDVQQSRMQTEIESLDDIQSLRLIRDASVHSQRAVSDAASRRLLRVEDASTTDQVSASNTSQSFHTADERQPDGAAQEEELESIEQPQRFRLSANKRARSRDWIAGPATDRYGEKLQYFDVLEMAWFGRFPPSLHYIRETLLQTVEGKDLWEQEVSIKNQRMSQEYSRATKRIVSELHRSNPPRWVAWTPINFDIFHILAGIEGPPDTPYEGGVFWLEIRLPQNYPGAPPSVRFLTRIYHPNIDSRGKICMDILDQRWAPVFNLESLLVCICSIFDDPSDYDPLVPEIAEIYTKDYDLYFHNAKTYTDRYAVQVAERTPEQQKDGSEEGHATTGP